MDRVVIEPRYCGPPGLAHGGYVAGLIADHAGALQEPRQWKVRLLQPIPLAVPLEIAAVNEALELRQDARVLARAEAHDLQLVVPSPPDYLQALDASRSFSGFVRHAFPNCFVCGTERPRGEGMRVFAGALPARDIVAAPWTPAAAFGGSDGKVQPRFMAAALDCPGYFAARDDGVSMLLGEFTVHIDRCVHVDEPCILIGWRLGVDGRKYSVGTALFDEDGELCARAQAIWIEPRATKP